MQQQRHYQQLIDLFDSCSAEEFSICLAKDGDEPVCLPTDDGTSYHRIASTYELFASALHETSRWCVAGKVYHERVDSGY